MLELQQLSAAFDPLTADTEGVKMAPIISPSPADLLVAAASVRLSTVSRTHPPPLRPVPHNATSSPQRRARRLSCDVAIRWFQMSESALIMV